MFNNSPAIFLKKYLFYTCTNFERPIRLNAEVMFLLSLKLCSWTSHFIIDHKGQFWHRFWEKPCMFHYQKEKGT